MICINIKINVENSTNLRREMVHFKFSVAFRVWRRIDVINKGVMIMTVGL